MLLDVAGYGFLQHSSHFSEVLSQLLLGAVSLLFGSIALIAFTTLALLTILLVSLFRGVRHRSVPKLVGTFFRLAGILSGVLISVLFLPLAFLFQAGTALLVGVPVLAILTGFLAGRAISRRIGVRIRRMANYMRAFDNLRGKIVRLVYSF